ncbi:MAG: hypothetical protein R3Y64_09565 [Peptostreptococcaceae bacterium]
MKKILILIPMLFMIGCGNPDIGYNKIPDGNLLFSYVENSKDSELNKFIESNYKKSGLHVYANDKDTYLLYSLGEKSSYGNGISNIDLVKKDNIITLNLVEYSASLGDIKKESNIPHKVIKLDGLFEEKFIVKKI